MLGLTHRARPSSCVPGSVRLMAWPAAQEARCGMLSTCTMADSSAHSLLAVEHSPCNGPCLPNRVRSGRRAPTPRSLRRRRRRRLQLRGGHADVSSRSACGHATRAGAGSCWSSRQRGRAAGAVQTLDGSARRLHDVDHPESRIPSPTRKAGRQARKTVGAPGEVVFYLSAGRQNFSSLHS